MGASQAPASANRNSIFNNEAGGTVNLQRLASETSGIGLVTFGQYEGSTRQLGALVQNAGTFNIAENTHFQLRNRRSPTDSAIIDAVFENQAGAVLNIGNAASSTDEGQLRLLTVTTLDGKPASAQRFENEGTVNLYGASSINPNSHATRLPGWTVTNEEDGVINMRDTSAIGVSDANKYIVFTNDGTINKTASGTATIFSNNDAAGSAVNNGTINVEAGTLLIQHDLTNTGTIRGGGTLSTPGLISTGGEIAPGNSIGTLTMNLTDDQGEIDFQSDTVFTFELAAPGTSDQVAFTGLSADSANILFDNNTVNFTDAGGLAVGLYTLFSFDEDNAYSGDLVIGTGLESFAGSSFVYNDDSIQLDVIPKPGSLLLLGLGGALVIALRRRLRD